MKRYPAYKDSGIEWIGQVPKNWDIAPIRALCYLGRGRVISNEEIANNFGEYPVYSSQTVEDGMMGRLNTYDFDGEYVTWTTDGANAGTVFHRQGRFNCTNVCGTLKTKAGKIFLKYLPYVLNLGTKCYVRYDINPKLMNNEMAGIRVPVPEHAEQKAIANYLDRKTAQIDELIAKKERMIDLLKEERTAIINQAVTKGLDPKVEMKDSGIEWLGKVPKHWEVKRLKYLVQGKLEYGANEVAELDDIKMPRYIRITDFDDDGNLQRDTFKSLSEDKAKEYLLQEGDVLFARSGATVGKTFQFKNYKGRACFAGYLIRARPNQKILSDFLYCFTRSNAYENWKNSIFNQATIQNIGADKYSILTLPLPSAEEQKEIVNFIIAKCERINGIIFRAEQSVELLKEYRTALISEVVTGKIDIRN